MCPDTLMDHAYNIFAYDRTMEAIASKPLELVQQVFSKQDPSTLRTPSDWGIPEMVNAKFGMHEAKPSPALAKVVPTRAHYLHTCSTYIHHICVCIYETMRASDAHTHMIA